MLPRTWYLAGPRSNICAGIINLSPEARHRGAPRVPLMANLSVPTAQALDADSVKGRLPPSCLFVAPAIYSPPNAEGCLLPHEEHRGRLRCRAGCASNPVYTLCTRALACPLSAGRTPPLQDTAGLGQLRPDGQCPWGLWRVACLFGVFFGCCLLVFWCSLSLSFHFQKKKWRLALY